MCLFLTMQPTAVVSNHFQFQFDQFQLIPSQIPFILTIVNLCYRFLTQSNSFRFWHSSTENCFMNNASKDVPIIFTTPRSRKRLEECCKLWFAFVLMGFYYYNFFFALRALYQRPVECTAHAFVFPNSSLHFIPFFLLFIFVIDFMFRN